jgi:hypothetical protein
MRVLLMQLLQELITYIHTLDFVNIDTETCTHTKI